MQVLGAAGVLGAGNALQGDGRHGGLFSAFSSFGAPGLGWAWAEGLTATGKHLLAFVQPARRGLAAATAPAAPPAESPAAVPAASMDSQSCQAIQAAAAAGAALNFTSVETFCLNQVRGRAEGPRLPSWLHLLAGSCHQGEAAGALLDI